MASSSLVTVLFSYDGDDLGVSGRQWMVAGVCGCGGGGGGDVATAAGAAGH